MPKSKRDLNTQEMEQLDQLRHRVGISALAKMFHVNKPSIKKAIEKFPKVSQMMPVSIPTGSAVYERER